MLQRLSLKAIAATGFLCLMVPAAQAQTLQDLTAASAARLSSKPQSLQALLDAASGKVAKPKPTVASLGRDAKSRSGGVFNTTEISSKALTALPQWSRVLKQIKRDQGAYKACLASAGSCRTAGQKNWRQVVLSAKGLSRRQKLNTVNKFFNRWPYRQDRQVYGKIEYWATPTEFMRRSGDCEDYSIAKYFALRELGFRADELRVVILMDNIRNVGHAVLAVYEANDILILDSLSNIIFSHKKYRHYEPQYSMNETARWAHVKGTNSQVAAGS